MTTFDEREKAYEKKFAHDQDLKFRAKFQAQQADSGMGGRQARH